MSRYLALTPYNAAGASALLSQGFAARTEQFRGLIEGLGGTLEGYYFSSNGQMVVMMTFEEPQNFALSTIQGMASGTWLEHADIQQIYDGAEMDAGLARQAVAYQPPGS